MPGEVSLREQQYYAHPRNAFWQLMESIFGINRGFSYEDRCRLLLARGVALWDVVKTCRRAGSLDADIVHSSILANDFAAFYSIHRNIRSIYFNGTMAQKSYRRYVLPFLPEAMANIPQVKLPSTSPAHAALNFTQKLAQWQRISTV